MIVDNNVVARVFTGAEDPDFSRLHQSLLGTGNPIVTLAYGGRLRREYLKNDKVRRVLLVLDAAGRAVAFRDDGVDAAEALVEATGFLRSDDAHVIALARISGARVLCSHDQDLVEDFKDKRLIDNPRGKVYKSTSHHHLLSRHCS